MLLFLCPLSFFLTTQYIIKDIRAAFTSHNNYTFPGPDHADSSFRSQSSRWNRSLTHGYDSVSLIMTAITAFSQHFRHFSSVPVTVKRWAKRATLPPLTHLIRNPLSPRFALDRSSQLLSILRNKRLQIDRFPISPLPRRHQLALLILHPSARRTCRR